MEKGKVTDYDLRSYFKDNQLNYLFILEINESYEYNKYLTQVEYNIFMSRILGGFGVRELRDIVDKSVDYELDNDKVVKISLENNIEL
jgi:hypothetical protein